MLLANQDLLRRPGKAEDIGFTPCSWPATSPRTSPAPTSSSMAASSPPRPTSSASAPANALSLMDKKQELKEFLHHFHQELRGILNEHCVNLAPPAVRNIGIEGRLVRDGVRKALANRRRVIEDLVKAIGEYRKSGGDHQSVHALNKALERAELLLS